LSPSLFEKGHLPAIDIGTSVSRVGGKVQLPAFRAVAGNLRLMYAQFEELETFARFGTQLDAETRRKLTRGLRVREVLKQREHEHIDVPEQIAALLAATEGLFDELEPDAVAEAEQTVREAVRAQAPEICDRIAEGAKLDDDDRAALIEAMQGALAGAQTGASDGDA
jgi:F-type H+-transporting ATPase subunit alpha